MAAEASKAKSVPGNQRIEGFSDGVFAIAITILVLELRVPDHLPDAGLAGMLPEMIPKFAVHFISFLVLGAYWVGHHNMLMHIRRHDRIFLWLNLLFLMFIGIMPFSAGLVVSHSSDQLALVVYGVNLIAAGLAADGLWWYASSGRRLVSADMDADLVTFAHRRALAAPALYLVAMGVSFLSQAVGMVCFLIVPLLYVLPTPLVTYHDKFVAAAHGNHSGFEAD
jgi:uncharacterized membrane protein